MSNGGFSSAENDKRF